jgi:hypothetical protein
VSRFLKSILSLAAVSVVACMSLPGLAQSPGDIKITTNTEVAVPGHLLEPGTYCPASAENGGSVHPLR